MAYRRRRSLRGEPSRAGRDIPAGELLREPRLSFESFCLAPRPGIGPGQKRSQGMCCTALGTSRRARRLAGSESDGGRRGCGKHPGKAWLALPTPRRLLEAICGGRVAPRPDVIKSTVIYSKAAGARGPVCKIQGKVHARGAEVRWPRPNERKAHTTAQGTRPTRLSFFVMQ